MRPGRTTTTVAVALLAALALAACGASSHSGAAADRSTAAAAASSIMADPTVSADVSQAKALVASCFTGTPLQQIHLVHLVFLSSATGKHGAEVVAARDKTFGCLGIPPDQRQAFINAALAAAEHGNLATHDGRVTYLEGTLPGLVLRYKGLPAQSASPSASAGASA